MSAAVIWIEALPRPIGALRPDPEDGDNGGAHPRAGAGPDPAASSAPRILIVEDDWMVSSQIEAVLEAEGFIIVGKAPEADEAVRLAGATRPDLVLMDIRLQGSKDGITAAISIRNQFGIPSLYVTANSDPGTVARGNAAAPAGWVDKPFTEPHLVAAVKKALARN